MSEWRKVPGFEYQINIDTPQGRCRKIGKVKELSNNPNKRDGRLYWGIYKDGKPICRQAAAWIALTYPELIQNEWFPGAQIDHIDTNPMNNHPSNLRWVTHKENQNNPLTKQHIGEGHLNHPATSKWVIKLSLNNEILHFYPSTKQAERETGVNCCNISKCCSGKYKSAGGYIWKYAE